MSTTAARTISIAFSGDVVANDTFPAATNSNSPGATDLINLGSGDNTITVPTGGAVAACCTIIKPAGNAATIKFKGVGGDTGHKLNATEPDSITLDPTVTTFVLNASAPVTGVRLVWS